MTETRKNPDGANREINQLGELVFYQQAMIDLRPYL